MREIWAIAAVAVLLCAGRAAADDQAISAATLSGQQFEALSPDTVLDFNGAKMTKREFQERNQKAAAEAAKMIEETKQRAKDQYDALVRKKLDSDRTTLATANKRVQDMADRLKAGGAAGQSADWDARTRRATELLEQAKNLEKEAADLLAPAK